jgi:hypothetical protein
VPNNPLGSTSGAGDDCGFAAGELLYPTESLSRSEGPNLGSTAPREAHLADLQNRNSSFSIELFAIRE